MTNLLNKFREPVNGLTHFFAAMLGVVGWIVLLFLSQGELSRVVSLSIYGFSVILLFSASASYHLANASVKTIQSLRKFDHSAIFILIAGSYTPFCVLMFNGFWQWGLLVIIWTIAIIGVVVKIFFLKAPRWLNTAIYLIMGWLVVIASQEMLRTLQPGAIVLLAAGGIIYSVGAVIYATKIFDFAPGKFGFHEIWHIFVILGAAAHYFAIAIFVAPLGS